VEEVWIEGRPCVRRVPCGGRIPFSRLVARALARRERRALARLEGIDGIPRLVESPDREFLREYVEGERLDAAGPLRAEFFSRLRDLVGKVHARGVAHNDLAKEANILVRPDGSPVLLDFQLAVVRSKGWIGEWIFRTMVRDNLRHILKQMAKRRPDLVTEEDRRLLRKPSLPARLWRFLVKPVYNFVTRRILHTEDREGLGPRRPPPPAGKPQDQELSVSRTKT